MYRYRLGWRSLRVVTGRKDVSVDQYKAISVDLGEAMRRFEITKPERVRCFLATVLHESGGFRYREEIASGAGYEGRRDLGNTQPGDGRRYKGRSYIQITGRANYRAVSNALGVNFLANPQKLAEPKYAARAAAWWFKTNGCNELADRGGLVAVTKRVNGGYNGMADRKRYYSRVRPLTRFLTPARRKP